VKYFVQQTTVLPGKRLPANRLVKYFMKFLRIILVFIITEHTIVNAQLKQNSSTTQQAKSSSPEIVKNRLPDTNKLDSYHRNMLLLIKEQNKINEYAKLYDYLHQQIKIGGQVSRTEENSIFSNSLKNDLQSQSEPALESMMTRLLWEIISSGYTLEKLNELSSKGLNVLDIVGKRGNNLISSVLCSDLVILCTIDSLYYDEESFADANRTSIVVRVNETLKGDSNIKKLIIRQPGFLQNGKYLNMSMHSKPFAPSVGDTYLLSVSKRIYELSIKQPSPMYFNNYNRKPIIRYDSATINKRQYCYRPGIISVSLGKNGELFQSKPINSEVKNTQETLQKVRDFCKKYQHLLP
jgi:hypothetical protein